MKRNIAQFADRHFDVVIVGGGIYGVCAAWDAALRGLSVALVEKGDFGSATSSNSLKIIHGGLRYLQHADFKRMRESISERSRLMRIAPHLVHPLPCIMPTYGHALRSKEVMAVALLINDLVGYDRNRGLDPDRRIPRGRVLSRRECLKLIPGVETEGLTGGALWYDCQVENAERLLMAILRGAVEAGAAAANYVEMVDFKKHGDRITGIVARDRLADATFEISADLVINTSGPWVNNVLSHLNGYYEGPVTQFSAAMNLVIGRQVVCEYAVGIWSKGTFQDDDTVLSKGSRLFFIAPWREVSLIGTTHLHYDGDPENFQITEDDIQTFLDEVNTAYPAAELRREDVTYFYGGLLPSDGVNAKTGDVKLLKQYRILDHQAIHGIDGLITVIGVKYTTARDVAARAVDLALGKLGKTFVPSRTCETPVFGGDVADLQDFIRGAMAEAPYGLSAEVMENLVRNYGSRYGRVLAYCADDATGAHILAGSTLEAEVMHAVREEMAVTLADVVRRRTDLGTAGAPDAATLQRCVDIVGRELSWDGERQRREIRETLALYAPACEGAREHA